MRLSRLAMLCLGALSLSACGSDKVTVPVVPPSATVRFINGVNDTGAVDIRPVDIVGFPYANNLAFRSATVYYPSPVGLRQFRVFLTSTNITVTSKVMLDVTVSLVANVRQTIVLTGSARAGTLALWVINDDAPPPPANQISVRMVNASTGSTGSINGYITADPADPLPGSMSFTAVRPLAPTSYVNRPAGATAVQATDAGSSTVAASAAGPAHPTTLPGEFPAAGVDSEGSVFSAYFFTASVPGSGAPQTTLFLAPAVVWYVDLNPCDVRADGTRLAACKTL